MRRSCSRSSAQTPICGGPPSGKLGRDRADPTVEQRVVAELDADRLAELELAPVEVLKAGLLRATPVAEQRARSAPCPSAESTMSRLSSDAVNVASRAPFDLDRRSCALHGKVGDVGHVSISRPSPMRLLMRPGPQRLLRQGVQRGAISCGSILCGACSRRLASPSAAAPAACGGSATASNSLITIAMAHPSNQPNPNEPLDAATQRGVEARSARDVCGRATPPALTAERSRRSTPARSADATTPALRSTSCPAGRRSGSSMPLALAIDCQSPLPFLAAMFCSESPLLALSQLGPARLRRHLAVALEFRLEDLLL